MTVREMPATARKYADRISVLWQEDDKWKCALADGFVYLWGDGSMRHEVSRTSLSGLMMTVKRSIKCSCTDCKLGRNPSIKERDERRKELEESMDSPNIGESGF